MKRVTEKTDAHLKKKLTLSLLLGIALSTATLYLALRNVPVAQLFDYLRRINYYWVLPSVVSIVAAFTLRGWRWKLILEAEHRVSFQEAFHPLMIGFLINIVLPGRMGEFARPAILRQKNRIPFTAGLTTVVAERLFDLITLLILFALTLSTVTIDPTLDIPFGEYHLNKVTLETIGSGMVKICLLLLAGVLLVSIHASRKVIVAAINRLPSLFFFTSEAVQEKITTLVCIPLIRTVHNIISGLALVRKPSRLVNCFLISCIIWLLHAVSYYFMTLGSPGIELGFFQVTAMMVIVCFFIALPSAPGYWGLWEAGGVFSLSLFNIAAKEAAGFTLANHLIQLVPIMVIGIGSAMLTGVNLLKITQK